MKYIYDKIEENDLTKPFIKTMQKLDLLNDTIDICRGINDDRLYDELEAKQCRLVIKLTGYYNYKYGFKTEFSEADLKEELKDENACLSEYMNQQNITAIEKQLRELTGN